MTMPPVNGTEDAAAEPQHREVLGLGWSADQLSTFLARTEDRDEIVEALLGYVGNHLPQRFVLAISRDVLKGFDAQGVPVDRFDLRGVEIDGSRVLKRLRAQKAGIIGLHQDLGLTPLYDQCRLEHPLEVLAQAIRLGNRPVLLLVADNVSRPIPRVVVPRVALAMKQVAAALFRLVRKKRAAAPPTEPGAVAAEPEAPAEVAAEPAETALPDVPVTEPEPIPEALAPEVDAALRPAAVVETTPEPAPEVTPEAEAFPEPPEEPAEAGLLVEPPAEAPPEAEVFAEPPAEVPPEAEVFAEPPAEPPAEAEVFAEPPSEAEVYAELPSEAEVFAEPPAEAEVFVEPPAEAEVFAEPPAEPAPDAEALVEPTAEPAPEAEALVEPAPEAEVMVGPTAEELLRGLEAVESTSDRISKLDAGWFLPETSFTLGGESSAPPFDDLVPSEPPAQTDAEAPPEVEIGAEPMLEPGPQASAAASWMDEVAAEVFPEAEREAEAESAPAVEGSPAEEMVETTKLRAVDIAAVAGEMGLTEPRISKAGPAWEAAQEGPPAETVSSEAAADGGAQPQAATRTEPLKMVPDAEPVPEAALDDLMFGEIERLVLETDESDVPAEAVEAEAAPAQAAAERGPDEGGGEERRAGEGPRTPVEVPQMETLGDLFATPKALVDALVSDDEKLALKARAELLLASPAVLEALKERFPGPVVADPSRPDAPEDPSELGPLLAAAVELGPRFVPHLLQLMNSVNSRIRLYATVCSRGIRHPDLLWALADRLFDGEASIRGLAAPVLATYSEREDFQPLLKKLRQTLLHERPPRQVAAAQALATLADEDSVPFLIELVDASETAVAQATQAALERITFQAFGRDKKKWLRWFNKRGRESRREWLVAGMTSRRLRVRELASKAIAELPDLDFEYNPEASRRELKKMQRRLGRHFELPQYVKR